MKTELVGRDEELAALNAFVAGADPGARALLLEGEAGIGKTSLLEAAVEEGRRAGYRVFLCRPSGAEVQLGFASLGDVLAGARPEIDDLPAPQCHALRVALLLEEQEGPPPDERAIGLAVAGVFKAAAPLVLAVDDAQWLDAASAAALGFALRRLEGEVAVIVACRSLGGEPAPLDLERTFDALQRVSVGPLSLGALHRLLQERLGRAYPRPLLRRIHATSGGNPFYALELARAAARGESSLPESLTGLVADRIGSLPASTRALVLAAAALAEPTTSVLLAIGREADLERAEQEEILRVDGGRVEFVHPLIAAASYDGASSGERRRVHRKLAELVGSREERARQFALAADAPSEEIAAELEAAAIAASARGALAAGLLAEEAVRLTPPEDADAVGRRSTLAARLRFAAGDTTGARKHAETAALRVPPGEERARALLLLGEILRDGDAGQLAAVDVCEQALLETNDPALLAEAHAALAFALDNDLARGADHARSALELLQRVQAPEPRLEAHVLKVFAFSEYYRGGGVRVDLLERAATIERDAPPVHVAYRARAWLGQMLKYTDDYAGARSHLEWAYQAARDESAEGSQPDTISHLVELELWTGDWALADRYADEGLELAERTEQELQIALNHYTRALVDAHLGRVEAARSHAEATLAAGGDNPWLLGIGLWVLGFLELSLGDLAAVDRLLTRADEIGERIGLVEPGQWRFHGDHIEALVGLGDLERADRLCARLEARGEAFDRTWALGTAARGRGLLEAARGDLPAALAALEASLVHFEGIPLPFDRGRTMLAYGSVLRRAARRKEARGVLEQAGAIFEELGARLWAERVRDELARVSGRGPASSELTATEQRVAELVAAGKTNREAAAELFVTVRTIEANLSRVYRKLGIRSRTELARTLSRRS